MRIRGLILSVVLPRGRTEKLGWTIRRKRRDSLHGVTRLFLALNVNASGLVSREHSENTGQVADKAETPMRVDTALCVPSGRACMSKVPISIYNRYLYPLSRSRSLLSVVLVSTFLVYPFLLNPGSLSIKVHR